MILSLYYLLDNITYKIIILKKYEKYNYFYFYLNDLLNIYKNTYMYTYIISLTCLFLRNNEIIKKIRYLNEMINNSIITSRQVIHFFY